MNPDALRHPTNGSDDRELDTRRSKMNDFYKVKGWTFNYLDMKEYDDGKQLQDVWKFPLCQGPQ